jgi:hypothetical protein
MTTQNQNKSNEKPQGNDIKKPVDQPAAPKEPETGKRSIPVPTPKPPPAVVPEIKMPDVDIHLYLSSTMIYKSTLTKAPALGVVTPADTILIDGGKYRVVTRIWSFDKSELRIDLKKKF